ncbi:MAG: hypothetical protein ABIH86_07725 [Planctomycetota bacterium]
MNISERKPFALTFAARLAFAAFAFIAPLPFATSSDCDAASVAVGVDSQGFSVCTIYVGDGWFYDTYYDVCYYDPYYDPSMGEWRYAPIVCAWFFVCFGQDEDIETVADAILAAAIISEIAGYDCAVAESRTSHSYGVFAILAGLATFARVSRSGGAKLSARFRRDSRAASEVPIRLSLG